MGMKSFSTTSLAAELEKEDKIRELEIIIDNQSRRIEELEMMREAELSKEDLVNGSGGHLEVEQPSETADHSNGYTAGDDDEVY